MCPLASLITNQTKSIPFTVFFLFSSLLFTSSHTTQHDTITQHVRKPTLPRPFVEPLRPIPTPTHRFCWARLPNTGNPGQRARLCIWRARAQQQRVQQLCQLPEFKLYNLWSTKSYSDAEEHQLPLSHHWKLGCLFLAASLQYWTRKKPWLSPGN